MNCLPESSSGSLREIQQSRIPNSEFRMSSGVCLGQTLEDFIRNSPFEIRNSDAVAVLALHGFTGCGADFDFPKTYLPNNYIWETPDLPPLALPALCRFLRERWENLPSNHPRVLLGYSMGGRIALHLARELPWREGDKLVLISASPGIADAQERKARRLADFALAEKIETLASAEKFYAEWRKNPLIATQDRLPSPWRERVLAQRASADFRVWAAHLRVLGTGTLPPLWSELVALPAPETLLIVGEEDKKFCNIAEKMNALIPRSRLCVVPACGHAPHWECVQKLQVSSIKV